MRWQRGLVKNTYGSDGGRLLTRLKTASCCFFFFKKKGESAEKVKENWPLLLTSGLEPRQPLQAHKLPHSTVCDWVALWEMWRDTACDKVEHINNKKVIKRRFVLAKSKSLKLSTASFLSLGPTPTNYKKSASDRKVKSGILPHWACHLGLGGRHRGSRRPSPPEQRQQTHLSGADSTEPDTAALHSSAQLSVVRFFPSGSPPASVPSKLCVGSAW